MLPPVVTKTVEHLTSAVISFAVIMVAGAFVARHIAQIIFFISKPMADVRLLFRSGSRTTQTHHTNKGQPQLPFRISD